MEHEPTLPDNPLHTMDNVVLTPHTASVSDVGNVAAAGPGGPGDRGGAPGEDAAQRRQ